MILLDTNALIWLHHGHRRGRPLEERTGLYVSPAAILEIQLLLETGRIRLHAGAGVRQIADDGRWMIDDPSSLDWFDRALEIAWTRDPFDRLLVAHAQLRGWRIATADGQLLERLGPAGSLEL